MSDKILILTEKREAASDMAATLGDAILGSDAKQLAELGKKKGYLEGEKYLLTWAAGHLFSQVKPKEINPQYGLFQRFENPDDYKMPDLKDQIKYTATPDSYKKRQREIIKDLLSRDDVKEIIIATDADAEGEAIGRDMIFRINPKPKAPIKRFWNTGSFKAKESVQKAMQDLKPFDDPKFEHLYASQQARSFADYLTGMKITKALTDLYNKPFYTGRVKSVIVSLIGNRELEIKHFVPKDYWQIKGIKGDLELSHFFYKEVDDFDAEGNPVTKKEKQRNYYKKEEVDKVLADLEDLTGTVEKMKTTTTSSKKRPLPLSGSDFASEMMGKYKISYGQCNEILDYLRQEGFTTYPGTNGRYFAQADQEEVIYALGTAIEYFGLDNAEFSSKSYIFNDAKAAKQNHTPLSLTPKVPTPSDIETWEKHKLPKIKEAYELIAKRIAVAFLPDDEIEKQELVISMNTGGHKFDLTGQRAIKQGWRSFMGMEVKDTTFKSETPLKEGDPINLDKVTLKTSKTKCPSPYTVKTLLDTLLNVTRVVDKLIEESDDPEYIKKLKAVKKQLKNAEGIGTDRTREQIIKDLIDNAMIGSSGKDEKLALLEAGWELYKVLPAKLKSVVLTANWENSFEEIRRGEIDLDQAIENIDGVIMDEMIPQIIHNLGKEVSVAEKKQSMREQIDVSCPLCDAPLVETEKVFRCSKNEFKNGKQNGCKFSIFKDQSKFFGRPLKVEDLEKLFKSTEEDPMKEEAHAIFFDPENKYYITTIFDKAVKVDDTKLIETAKTFKKNGRFVFKEFRGKNLTKSQAEKLLDGGSVTLTRKSKAGKDYKIKCTLSEKSNGSLETEFAD